MMLAISVGRYGGNYMSRSGGENIEGVFILIVLLTIVVLFYFLWHRSFK